ADVRALGQIVGAPARLLRSEDTAQLARLDVFDDEIVEARRLAKRTVAELGVERLTTLRALEDLGLEHALDPAGGGSRHVLQPPPPCPACGSRRAVLVDSTGFRSIPDDVVTATLDGWGSRDESSRIRELRSFLADALAAIDEHGLPTVYGQPRWRHVYAEQ